MRLLSPIRCSCLLALLFQITALLAQAPLTSVRDIRALSPEAAAVGKPVAIHGVVTTPSGWQNSFFFMDKTAGISVDPLFHEPAPRAGQRILLRGVTAPGSFAPVIHATSFVVEGATKLPHAPLRSAGELIGGQLDSQWIAIQGTVISEAVRPVFNKDTLVLNVEIDSGLVVAVRMLDFDRAHPQQLTGASVQISGVCATLFNARRQFVGLRLYPPAFDSIRVLHPAPQNPFLRPLQPMNEVLQFHRANGMHDLIRVSGIVTFQAPSGAFYLQDGDKALLVEWKNGTPPAVGTHVEAVGYPAVGHGSTRLQAEFLRTLPMPQTAVVSRPVQADKVLVEQDSFLLSPTEGLLVRIDGVLVESFPSGQRSVLLLKSHNTLFTVRVPSADGLQFAPGALLRVTGICTVDYDDYTNEPSGFYLQTRFTRDIAVLQPAPWWDTVHTFRVAVVLAFLVVVLLAIILLSKQASLRSLATTDSLTGLANRRSLLRVIERARCRLRAGQTLLLLYIDVNEFKQINDHYGHRQGDITLKRVAHLLRQTFPENLSIGRIGGDEFIVVMPQSEVQACACRLTAALAVQQQHLGNAVPFALSIGALECGLGEQESSVEDLLERADVLMYQQKRQTGRAAQTSNAETPRLHGAAMVPSPAAM